MHCSIDILNSLPKRSFLSLSKTKYSSLLLHRSNISLGQCLSLQQRGGWNAFLDYLNGYYWFEKRSIYNIAFQTRLWKNLFEWPNNGIHSLVVVVHRNQEVLALLIEGWRVLPCFCTMKTIDIVLKSRWKRWRKGNREKPWGNEEVIETERQRDRAKRNYMKLTWDIFKLKKNFRNRN